MRRTPQKEKQEPLHAREKAYGGSFVFVLEKAEVSRFGLRGACRGSL
jgi:hypothetical protein